MQMIPGVDLALCRTPEIMADAAYCVFTQLTGWRPATSISTTRCWPQHGITELDRYAVTPGNKNFLPDFFVD
jgi:citronellol/citronellal dehydrogenase